MKRGLILGAGLAIAGCGAIAGIKELDVVEQPSVEEEDSAVPDVSTAPPDDAGVEPEPPIELEAGCKAAGPFFPTQVTQNGGGNGWDNLAGIKAQDNVGAKGNGCCGSDDTNALNATSFGFAVPTTATIHGVKVEIRAKSVNMTFSDRSMRLTSLGTGPLGDNLKSPVSYSGAFENRVYGGESTLWGATLTPELVNKTDFGVTYVTGKPAFQNGLGTALELDALRMTVVYCE